MGDGMVRRLSGAGNACVVCDKQPAAVGRLIQQGAALFERFSSRGGGEFANRALSAMREEFGGHAEKSAA